MRMSPSTWTLPLALLTLAPPAAAPQGPPTAPTPTPTPAAYAENVQVTATRVPEDVDVVPASIQVVTRQELRDRGATDLRSALALAAGVDIAPGGDGGPASSVPEFYGLREFDAFLLVVDGVPWGGAFNPALASLDLADVERIEVQRGPAPVLYGATSFVGVIQVVRRAPGQGKAQVAAGAGSYGSGSGALNAPLPAWLGFGSSFSADFERQGFRDERTSFKKGHALWRNQRVSGRSVLRFDLDATFLRQQPASPTPRSGGSLTSQVPLDSNQNPAGARLDEDRYFVNLGYDRSLSLGTWNTTVAFTHSGQEQLRGFLTDVSTDDPNAAGFRAKIDQNDLYLDSHLAFSGSPRWRLVSGLDYLYGKADAEGDTFEYFVSLDGSNPPSSLPVGEERGIADKRNFAGLYANLEWSPASAWRVEAGLRLNRTEEERREGEEADEPAGEEGEDKREDFRPSGGVGVTWTAWQRDRDLVRLYGNWKSTFKPAAIDFNLAEAPAAEGESGILKPETSNGFEGGLKAELLDRALRLEALGFLMDFDNLVVAQAVGGLPALTNAGSTRLKGVELTAVYRAAAHFFARGAYSYHDARFRDYLTEFDGEPFQLAGNRLEMSPRHLAALALTWAPESGVFASAEVRYTGSRFLNKRNTALAGAYTTLGGLVGYRRGRFELRLSGRNLTDRRDPVAESELGDSQYYRLFPRRFDVAASVRF
jgi:outer membrane receptor protein involved in Fe transport